MDKLAAELPVRLHRDQATRFATLFDSVEDAIVISQRLVKDDVFTSIHIEEYDVEIRETKLGREEFTRDIPNVSERALANLDENGVVRVGTRVGPGDILVGKIAPKSKSELTPEEKLLHAIFGRAGEDVKNDSLEVPAGEEGVVIGAQRYSRRVHMTDEQKKKVPPTEHPVVIAHPFTGKPVLFVNEGITERLGLPSTR